ncbi:MAG: hypothetical protein DRH04_04785 [Deltaproteobacteria bacterium]|nr:MAG: hypothetical protein DRH04_04785 [Deltaproteobacteria bacterium]
MNESSNILKTLEEFFSQADAKSLCQRLEEPTPGDPYRFLCIQINEFLERLAAAAGGSNYENPLLAAILENAPYGIITIDTQGTIEFSNKLADFLLDQSDTTLAGRSFLEILLLKKADTRKLNLLLQEESTLRPQRITLTFSDQQDAITLSFTLIPYRSSSNDQRRIVVFIEDLTGKATLSDAINFYTENLESMVKQKTKEIQAMQAKMIEAERAAAMISTAGGIAHELRQPLTAIIAAAELLADNNTTMDSHQERKINMIHQQSLRMADIIKKMEKLVSYQTREYVTGTKILDIDESSREDS